jgi:hypothetical protein
VTAGTSAIILAQQLRLAETADAFVTRWQGFYGDAPTARPGAADGHLSLLFASVRQDGGTWGGDDQPLFELTPTTMTLAEGNPGTQFFSLQWLVFPSSSGTEYRFSDNRGSDSHGTTSFPIDVGSDIDWTRSILRYSSWNGANNGPREWMFKINSFDTQGVTLERMQASWSDTRLAGQIIQFDDGTTVQHVTQAFGDGASSRTYTLDTAVPSSRTLLLNPHILGRGASSRQWNEDRFGLSMFTTFLTNCADVGGVEMCDKIRFVRRSDSTDDARSDATLQVVTFPHLTVAPTPAPTPVPTPSPPTTTTAGATDDGSSSSSSTPAAGGSTTASVSPGAGMSSTASLGTPPLGDSSVDSTGDEEGEGGNSTVGIVVALIVVLLLCVLLGVYVVRKRKENSSVAATASARVGPTLPVGPTGPSKRMAEPAEPTGEYGSIASLRETGGTYDTADSALDGASSAYGTVDQVRTSQITYGSLPNVQHSDTQGLYAAAPAQV